MTKKLKRLDLLFNEVKDPYAQENFWRIKLLISELQASGALDGSASTTPGPPGPPGPTGATPTSVPKLIATFNTDVGTAVGDLVRLNGAASVTDVLDNLSSTIPNGIFGVGFFKPTTTTIEVIFGGIIGGYSGFTPGLPIFVSVLGTPTHAVPITGMVQQIGFAISTTEFFVQLMQAMRRS